MYLTDGQLTWEIKDIVQFEEYLENKSCEYIINLFKATFFEKVCQDDVNKFVEKEYLKIDERYTWSYTYDDSIDWLKTYITKRFGEDYCDKIFEKLLRELDWDIYFRLNHIYN